MGKLRIVSLLVYFGFVAGRMWWRPAPPAEAPAADAPRGRSASRCRTVG